MGATNHTTNYNLPQFIGSDKPTWLGDVNGAMSAIDTQMKANDTLGNTAKTTADTALTNAATAQTAANNAQTKADTADTTANSALSKSLSNETNILSLEQKLSNFTTNTYSKNDVTISNGTISDGQIQVDKNANDSLVRIYGDLYLNVPSVGSVSITVPSAITALDEDYAINNLGQQSNFNNAIVTFGSNGNIVISTYISTPNTSVLLRLYPILVAIRALNSD